MAPSVVAVPGAKTGVSPLGSGRKLRGLATTAVIIAVVTVLTGCDTEREDRAVSPPTTSTPLSSTTMVCASVRG